MPKLLVGKLRFRRLWMCFVAALIVVLTLGFAFHRYVLYRADAAIADLTTDGRTVLLHGTPITGQTLIFEFDTVNHSWLTNQAIGTVFDRTTANLTSTLHLSPDIERYTDPEGWPFLRAVWSLPDAHVILAAGSGNDSNLIYLRAHTGPQVPNPATRPASRSELESIFNR